MHFTNRPHTQSGFNLIETALVLGIVGLVIGGIFAAWGTVVSQQRVRKGADMASLIVQQVRSTYATRTSLDAASGADFTNALINSELIPRAWVTSNVLVGPWGGNLLVTPETISSNSAMNVSFAGMGKEDCLKLASMIFGAWRSQGLIQIDSTNVNTNSVFTTVQSGVCASGTLSLHFTLKTNS